MMKRILKVVVLLVSISAASILVWNAAREKAPMEQQVGAEIAPEEMQASSKSKVIIGLDKFKELKPIEGLEFMVSPKFGPVVTEEELKRTRDMMMSTSKSGIIMSDDQIRKMLEEQKREKDIRSQLMSSSKSIDAVLDHRDLKKIIEGEKKDSSNDDELPPQE